MKIILVTLLLSGCINLAEFKVRHFQDDMGKCHLVSKQGVLYNVECPKSFIGQKYNIEQ